MCRLPAGDSRAWTHTSPYERMKTRLMYARSRAEICMRRARQNIECAQEAF